MRMKGFAERPKSSRSTRKEEDALTFCHSDHVVVVSTFLAKLSIDQITKNWSVTPNAIRKGQELESTSTCLENP